MRIVCSVCYSEKLSTGRCNCHGGPTRQRHGAVAQLGFIDVCVARCEAATQDPHVSTTQSAHVLEGRHTDEWGPLAATLSVRVGGAWFGGGLVSAIQGTRIRLGGGSHG